MPEEIDIPKVPLSRTEQYLAKIVAKLSGSGKEVEIPTDVLSRVEAYLRVIIDLLGESIVEKPITVKGTVDSEDQLPQSAAIGDMYFVRKDDKSEEFIFTEHGWDPVGDTSVDLSDYITVKEIEEPLTRKVRSIDNNILSLQADYTDVETEQGTQNTDIASLKNDKLNKTEAESTYAKQTDLSALSSSVDDISQTLEEESTAIDTLYDSKLDKAVADATYATESDLSALKTTVNGKLDSITAENTYAKQTDLTTLESTVAGHTTRLTSLDNAKLDKTTAVSTYATISALNALENNVTDSAAELDERLTTLDNTTTRHETRLTTLATDLENSTETMMERTTGIVQESQVADIFKSYGISGRSKESTTIDDMQSHLSAVDSARVENTIKIEALQNAQLKKATITNYTTLGAGQITVQFNDNAKRVILGGRLGYQSNLTTSYYVIPYTSWSSVPTGEVLVSSLQICEVATNKPLANTLINKIEYYYIELLES